MPSPSHDILVQSLRDDPALLLSLLARATGRELPGATGPMDSSIRLARPLEVRPDLVVGVGDTWLACEVQNRIDARKARRWLLGAAVLHDATRQMGELVVLTASPRVARWAQDVAHVRGPVTTTLRLSPLVVLLDADMANKLLDSGVPELALCAAWAVRRRRGRRAKAIVERAIEVTEALPEPLRFAQLHAILSVLSAELRAHLEQIMINPDHIYESPAHRAFRLRITEKGRKEGEAKGEAQGLAEALLLVLEARGISLAASDRKRILACKDKGKLSAWTKQAATATSIAEALANDTPQSPPPRPRRRRVNGG